MLERHGLTDDPALVEMGRIIRDADVSPSRTRVATHLEEDDLGQSAAASFPRADATWPPVPGNPRPVTRAGFIAKAQRVMLSTYYLSGMLAEDKKSAPPPAIDARAVVAARGAVPDDDLLEGVVDAFRTFADPTRAIRLNYLSSRADR
jgi:hypothetical protein